MELMNKCTCGSSMCINIGESIQGGIFRWYVSYHCNNCGKNIEMDGSGVESIPKDIQALIIEQKGRWGLKSLSSEIKIKYLLRKILENYGNLDLPKDILYCGTQNQVKWLKSKLIEKGVAEKDLQIKRLEYRTEVAN